jgi:glutamate-1-semialdehyde 2,1-aminomutase
MPVISRNRLRELYAREERRFVQTHPRSKALAERASESLLQGVPMNWMVKWAGPFPVFVDRAQGAHFTCVDGREYVDFCMGDTGAMSGHSPRATVESVVAQIQRGITSMLPSEDAVWLGEELQRRFGLKYWQFTLTATDANRFAIRIAREITARPKILIFNYCYHGSVDETFATLRDGAVVARSGNIGPPVDPSLTTRVVEFNDVDALEAQLAHRDVACVLTEPALTNVGIVHPDPEFHRALRELTRRYGSLLILDETHTICTGGGGYTRAHGLDPDFFTLGKPIGGGIPGAVYGFTESVGNRIVAHTQLESCDTGGIGGTLAGNALSLAAMRATLERVLTAEAFDRMIPLAGRFTDGVQSALQSEGIPWNIARLGCRAEYAFCAQSPHNGAQAAAAADFELDRLMHLHALNRGVLLTPFHNMALMSPQTNEADVDRHTSVFEEAISELTGASPSKRQPTKAGPTCNQLGGPAV